CACHLVLPSLPAFPTRRSSDLAARIRIAAARHLFAVHPQPDLAVDAAHVVVVPLAHAAAPLGAREAARSVGRARLERLQLRVTQDRKSTRLNSSHVKISYAVFC